MPSMAIQLLLFAAAIGLATFVEDIHGTLAAKAVIYNTWWFEMLMLLLSVSLVWNMFRYNMFRWEKLPVLTFHLSLIVILIGAGFTRYMGIDGNLHVRENKLTDYITSTDVHFKVKFHNSNYYSMHEEKVRLTPLSGKNLNTNVLYDNKKYKIRSESYLRNAYPLFDDAEDGIKAIDLMVSHPGDKRNVVLTEGRVHRILGTSFGMSDKQIAGISFQILNDSLYCLSDNEFASISMTGGDSIFFPGNTLTKIHTGFLYQYDELKFVIRDYYSSVEMSYAEAYEPGMKTEDIVQINIKNDDINEKVYFPYSTKSFAYSTILDVNNTELELTFGSKIIDLPFSIYLTDFVVNRYVGSNSPSSFDSYVSVINSEGEKQLDYHIYMNHILNYEGWRFYQNSFDNDEKGTILSVTYDKWGILLTYIGYFLLSLGMILSLFWKGTQFKSLLGFLKRSSGAKASIFLLFFGLSTYTSNSQPTIDSEFNKEVYNELGKVWVLDTEGRIKPMNTLFYEISRKIHGKGKINGIPAEKAIPDILFFPEKWSDEKIIKCGHDEIKDLIGIDGDYAAMSDFFEVTERDMEYKLFSSVSEAFKKAPPERSKLDNELIAVDERLNIFLIFQEGRMFKIFPDIELPERKWYHPNEKGIGINGSDSIFISSSLVILKEFVRSQDSTALIIVDGFSKFQKKYASEILPSDLKNKLEVSYEKSSVFSKLSLVYLLISLVVILLILLSVLKIDKIIKGGLWTVHYILWILFAVQLSGLILRWYITGHAPLSNGYEAMLYVSLAGLLTGLIISYRNRLLLFVTAIFASAPLFVSHLSLMNPELTNLVPVLKSYWLTIHVTTITTSYAVLGFAAFLALLNIFIAAYFNGKNQFNETINEFTFLNQTLVILGLYLLTIGSFLGGIWANESWGTYWSWDPKETWSLVSILVYSFVAHIKHIPSLRSRITFNFATLLSYSTILMTYFGVNYFLGGMHSYGKGSAFDISYKLIIVIVILVFTLFFASYKENKLFSKNKE